MVKSIECPVPYSGVSGIVSSEQQHNIEQIARNLGLVTCNHTLGLGVKAHPGAFGMGHPPRKGSEWYPPTSDAFNDALKIQDPRTLRIAQVCMNEVIGSDPDASREFIRRIMVAGESSVNAIQLDQVHFERDPEATRFLSWVKETYGLPLILQCHCSAMEQLDSKALAEVLAGFPIDYVLLDASHGEGRRMDEAQLLQYAHAIHHSPRLGKLGIAVAGGLDAGTVAEVMPQFQAVSAVSTDAEGRMHPERSDGSRPLDINAVAAYLGASAGVIGVANCYNS